MHLGGRFVRYLVTEAESFGHNIGVETMKRTLLAGAAMVLLAGIGVAHANGASSACANLAQGKPPTESGNTTLAQGKPPTQSGNTTLAQGKPPTENGNTTLAQGKPPTESDSTTLAAGKPPTESDSTTLAAANCAQ